MALAEDERAERGDVDVAAVASEVVEVALQGVELAREIGEGGGRVELVGVLGGEAERPALALAADQDRDAAGDRGGGVVGVLHGVMGAGVRGRRLGEHPAADLEGVDEVLVAHLERRELEAEGGVLDVEPRRADAEEGSPA